MKNKARKTLVALLVFMFSFTALSAVARIGVGVGTGKIQMDEPLKPGGIYTLPTLLVINKGDEPSDFETRITYHEGIPEIRPAREWFSFSPQKFHLEPSASQVTEITLSLPLKVEPGNYFAYIEGHPLENASVEGGTSIGVAAAAKLYFSVAPANLWQGLYYKIISLWRHYAPWTYIASAVLLATLAFLVLRRFITLNIGFGVKKNLKKTKKSKERTGRQIKTEEKAGTAQKISLTEKEKMEVLQYALEDVERFTGTLPDSQTESVFTEAGKNKEAIERFFYGDDERFLSEATPNLRKILVLTKEGLEGIRKRDPEMYFELVSIVLKGFAR